MAIVARAEFLNRACPATLSASHSSLRSLVQFETPSRSAWTLPYIVTINEEYPFGLSVSHPEFYEGSIADDGRVEWYANRADKDVTLSATVRSEQNGITVGALPSYNYAFAHGRYDQNPLAGNELSTRFHLKISLSQYFPELWLEPGRQRRGSEMKQYRI